MTALWITLLKTVGLPLLGTGFMWLKGTEWWERKLGKKKAESIQIVAAAVDHVWKTYYKEMKLTLAQGAQRNEAKKVAMRRALQEIAIIGTTRGVDVLQTLGTDLIESYIEQEVRARKRDSFKPKPLTEWFDGKKEE